MIEFYDWIGRRPDGTEHKVPREWIHLEGKRIGWVELKPGHMVTTMYGLYDWERDEVKKSILERHGEEPSMIREPPEMPPVKDEEQDSQESSLVLPEGWNDGS